MKRLLLRSQLKIVIDFDKKFQKDYNNVDQMINKAFYY